MKRVFEEMSNMRFCLRTPDFCFCDLSSLDEKNCDLDCNLELRLMKNCKNQSKPNIVFHFLQYLTQNTPKIRIIKIYC